MRASYSIQGREIPRSELGRYPLPGAQVSAACDAARKRAERSAGTARCDSRERRNSSGGGRTQL